MTCSSPFVFEASLDYEVPFTADFSGSYVLPAYSIPSTQACLLGWSPPYSTCNGTLCYGCSCNCGWGGWNNSSYSCGWCSCCSQSCDSWQWTQGYNYWYDCWSTPSIPIWPNVNCSFTADVPMVAMAGVGVEISAGEAPYEPVEIASLTIESFDLNASINGTNFVINIPLGVQLTEVNGSFSAVFPLCSLTDSYEVDGFVYEISIGVNILFCLTPVAPVTWINLQVFVNFSVSYETSPGSVLAETNFIVAMPLIPEE